MRRCSNTSCKNPIVGCFGFVHAGDFMQAMAGKLGMEDIRELCGKCGLLPLLFESRNDLVLFIEQLHWHLSAPTGNRWGRFSFVKNGPNRGVKKLDTNSFFEYEVVGENECDSIRVCRTTRPLLEVSSHDVSHGSPSCSRSSRSSPFSRFLAQD